MAGKLVHIEFPAEDSTRAVGFYRGLFGWEFQTWDNPEVEYHMFQGEPGGAVYPSQSGERGPIVYFESEDIDADVARVRELGGEAQDRFPIPGVGWMARCRDTEGNPFCFFSGDGSAPAGG